MKAKTPVLLLVAVFFGGALLSAQQGEVAVVKANTPVKADAPAKTKPETSAKAMNPAEGDRAYKANCSRCHQATRKFSERKQATIMQHMRVRANLTEVETKAILDYLTR